MIGARGKNEGLLSKCSLVCKTVSGKWSAGGQKRRWKDVLMGNLKRCDLLEHWKKTVQDRVLGDAS